MNDRKIIYLDDAIDAIVGRTNCGTEDELRAYAARHSLENLWTGGIVDAIDAVEQLPSAQPERKTGKWIVYYECPKCGEITKDFTEYCPFCNADMRGAERREE